MRGKFMPGMFFPQSSQVFSEHPAILADAVLVLGVHPRLASNTAGSGPGPWYLAKAKALSVGLSNAYFKSLGLPSLFEEGLT
jgi:hypothetical protein